MKKIVMAMIAGCICLLSHFAGAFDGICPVCKAEGKKSRVYPGGCTSTLMYCGSGEYDEQGRYSPPHDCNHTTCSYRCSNGHSFSDGIGAVIKPEMFHAVGKFNNISTMR